MLDIEPSPQTTLVILLGASVWPFSTLANSSAYAKSANKVRDYFHHPHLFGLPSENWLDLFEKHQNSPNDVDQAISDFLEQRLSQMEQAGTPARDILFYYIGHGVFAPDSGQAYHLAIQSTRDESIGASAVAMASLAHTLKTKARYLRRIVILDCCFAAESFKYMQSAPDQVAIQQTEAAFEEKNKGSGFPKMGTALLCSSGHKNPSLILRDESGTMFSEALVRALSLENRYQQNKTRLSLYDLKHPIIDILENLAGKSAPNPEVHSPDQSDGDVASIPFFPNIRNNIQPIVGTTLPTYEHTGSYAPTTSSEAPPDTISDSSSAPLTNYKGGRTTNIWSRKRLQITTLVAIALLVPLLISSSSQVHVISSIPLVNAHIDGWLFVQASSLDGENVLKTLNLQTGQVRILADSTTVPNLTNFAAPYYSPVTHQLVFVADGKNQGASVWIAQVTVRKGWPTLSSTPTLLTSSCNTSGTYDPSKTYCKILTWSPKGQWLIFQGKDGLYAINISTHRQQLIPSSYGASWPACSPDGTWLAFEDAANTIEAVPSKDCLPMPQTTSLSHYVNGVAYAWHPRWSIDGKYLTFLSNKTEGWSLYEIALSSMPSFYTSEASAARYVAVGTQDCNNMTWAYQQSQRQNIAIFGCKNNSYLLIEPSDLQPDWQVIQSAGSDKWNWLNWMPPVASS